MIIRGSIRRGFGRIDFFPIHQNRLMQRSGIELVVGGDIEKIWDQTKDKESQHTCRESFRPTASSPDQHDPF